MINEEFDEEAAEDFDPAVLVREAEEPARPEGAWSRTLAGREIWFRPITSTQRSALRRFHQATVKQLNVLAPGDDDAAIKLANEFYDAVHEFVDSLFLDDADRRELLKAQLRGDMDDQELLKFVLYGEDPADDDAEPVSKPKPVKAANPAKAKKAANASRTRR
jgi:hypothetical protein